MIRPATQQDVASLRAFLMARIETSMFLLANLEAHGLSGADHPNATTYWLTTDDGAITGVLGLTQAGFVLVQMPDVDLRGAHGMLAHASGRSLIGITGATRQVSVFVDAPALAPDLWSLNESEPLFRLTLSDLAVPMATLRPPMAQDLAFLPDWFANYMAQTRTAPPGDLATAAQARAHAAIDGGKVWLLVQDGHPVAMAAINARTGGAVQVGGVYVPPALRGGGRASVMVAALLAQERAAGAEVAILFAASDVAARAYTRIGFQRVGTYHLALLKTSYELRGTP